MFNRLFSCCYKNNEPAIVAEAFSAVERADHEQLRELLTKTRLNPNCINKHRFTLLHAAVLGCKRHSEDDSLKCIQALIKAKANVNQYYKKNDSNLGPLHSAVRRKMPQVVECLLENRADSTLINRNGKTPVDYAKSYEDDLGIRIAEIFESRKTPTLR